MHHVTEPTGPTEPTGRSELVRRLTEAHLTLSESLLARRLAPLRATRLSTTQLKALSVLVLDGPLPAHVLAAALEVSPATVTGITDRLVAAGMARRDADPADGRVRVVVPTDQGLAALRALVVHADDVSIDILASLTVDEMTSLVTGFEALVRAAAATRDDRGEAPESRTADDSRNGSAVRR